MLPNNNLVLSTKIENATTLQQLQTIHRNSDGWITFFRKESAENVIQYHYKLDELNTQMLNEWVTNDSYFSMNTFFTPRRSMTNIRHLQTCYVDLDFYKQKIDINKVLYELNNDYFGIKIPQPNLINYSGRGMQLIWLLEPMSGLAIEKWSELQRELFNTLKSFGADPACLDASRVFRLAGSVNSKSNELVISDIIHTHEYNFYDIAKEYFPNMKALNFPKNKKPYNVKKKRKSNVRYLFNPFSLSKNRLDDLFKIVELRQGNCQNHREYFLFLCRYFSLQITDNETEEDKNFAIRKTAELNGLFTAPLREKEWLSATESAQRYADSGGIRLTNDTLIHWLDIKEEEQKQLSTIISKTEKKERKRLKNAANRRQQGIREKELYNLARKKKMFAQVKKLHILKSIYPKASLNELGERMKISKTTVHRYLKIISESFHELYALVKRETKFFVPVLKKNLSEDELYHHMNKFFTLDLYLDKFYKLLKVKLLE